MRRSAEGKPSNAHIISVQMDAESLKRLDTIARQLGVSRSMAVKMLVANSKIRLTNQNDEEVGE